MLVTIETEIPAGWVLAHRTMRPPRDDEFWLSPNGKTIHHTFWDKSVEYCNATQCTTQEARIIIRPAAPAVDLTRPIRDKHTRATMKYLGRLPDGRVAFGRQGPQGSWGTTSCEMRDVDGQIANYDPADDIMF